MLSRPRALPLLLTLLAALGLTLAALVWSVLSQSRHVLEATRWQGDSALALSFQLERAFLKFERRAQLAQLQRNPANLEQARQSYEVFVSRVELLRENPTTASLQKLPEYRRLLPSLLALVRQFDNAIEREGFSPAVLQTMTHALQDAGPGMQDLTFAVVRRLKQHSAEQAHVAESLGQWTLGLLGLLLLGFVLAALLLGQHYNRMQQERDALQSLNQDLSRARDEALAASRAKSAFLANMSHELRTPFNALRGNIELLQLQSLPAPQLEQLAHVQEASDHLLELLNALLDLSALEAGRLPMHNSPTRVDVVVQQVHDLMRAAAHRKGLDFQLTLPQTAPPACSLDALRLRQILINLLINAIKFTEKGGVQVTVQASPLPGQRWQWRVEVRDSGCGIPQDMRARLFQRFEQADPSQSRRHEGMGIGLNIARRLAQHMDGDLQLTSTGPDGTCMQLTLQAAQASEESPDSSATAVTAATQPQGRLRVLMAEDHLVNARLLEQFLQRLGHQVVWARDGQEALGHMQDDGQFDVVLMDIHMPGMDGLEATRAIRALPDRRARVPIHAVTADVAADAPRRYVDAGMDGLLAKPISMEGLRQLLAPLLALA